MTTTPAAWAAPRVPDELTGVLMADPPRFDEVGVERIAHAVFGFDGVVERRVESERDQTFLIVASGDDGAS